MGPFFDNPSFLQNTDPVGIPDRGEPVVLARPDSAAAKAFLELADNCHKFLNPEEAKAS